MASATGVGSTVRTELPEASRGAVDLKELDNRPPELERVPIVPPELVNFNDIGSWYNENERHGNKRPASML